MRRAAERPQPRRSANPRHPEPLGRRAAVGKAIPYYYDQDGTPPVFGLWNPQRRAATGPTRTSATGPTSTHPPAPAFVTDPLRFDLEPYNFLRIEGHLGKDYQNVLTSLLTLKSQYRLPIDIIALRTGAYDDSQPVDLTKESARFEDLESLVRGPPRRSHVGPRRRRDGAL